MRAQDSFLHQFGGSGKGTANVKATLARYPLRSRSLEPWYHALSYVVDINPGQAHAIVHQHPSLGQLMAIYADPARSASVPPFSLYTSLDQLAIIMAMPAVLQPGLAAPS